MEALKAGVTRILVCDNNYPDIKETVTVNVLEAEAADSGITEEMAYEGVKNYCRVTYDIIMTNKGVPYDQVLFHEMMHAIDYNASEHKYDLGGQWYDYNPEGFEYDINNYYDDNLEYTAYADEEDAYFVDAYAKVNSFEDKARTLENICVNVEIIKQYPSLLKKALYLKEEIIKYYPSLKDSEIFDGIEP